jgi:lipopolysaccharide export LptBFGC system permease protein LptF
VPARVPVVAPQISDAPEFHPRAIAAQLSGLSDVSDVVDQEAFYLRDVHQYEVEIHKKFTLSVACLNFVLIGIALALRFPRGGIGLVIGGSLVIFALFYVTLTAGETLADDGYISSALAMWLPNAIVLAAGLGGLLRVNREFGSTRGGDLADLTNLLFGWIPGRGR